jgi:hypothetical protein
MRHSVPFSLARQDKVDIVLHPAEDVTAAVLKSKTVNLAEAHVVVDPSHTVRRAWACMQHKAHFPNGERLRLDDNATLRSRDGEVDLC